MPTADPAALTDHRDGVGDLDGAVIDADGLIWNTFILDVGAVGRAKPA
jgi:sugar lactone lactonase YvrE